MITPLPWYLSVHDRPTKVVPTRDGGYVLALDILSGEFVRDLDQLNIHLECRPGVEDLTKDEFDKPVKWHRERAGLK